MVQGPTLTMKGYMKQIKYNNKTIKLPFKDADYGIDPLEEVTIKNRFSGQSTTMPAFAAAVYDVIIGAEMMEQYDLVRKGLDWFKQHFAEQYMVVLD
jgi:trimethylamine:corrinoid methyltransferase-like protein